MTGWAWFWELIHLAAEHPEGFERALREMSEAELVDFYWTYEQAAADLKDEEFVQHMAPPVTEDHIDDVAQWVVSRGLDYYEAVMLDPASIPPELPEGATVTGLTGAAQEIYEERYGSPIRFRDEPPPDE